MRIGRKEALLAFVASIVPWMSRGAHAQAAGAVGRVPLKEPFLAAPTTPAQTVQLADLQRRIVAIETQLANQVAFTKDASGNLNLRGNANVTIDAGTNLTFRGGAAATLRAGGNAWIDGAGAVKITGAAIALN